MDQIHWDIFDKTHERFDHTISQLDTIRDLISPNGEEDWFDSEGMWTEKGVASLATYIDQLTRYDKMLESVSAELNNLSIGDFDSEQEYY